MRHYELRVKNSYDTLLVSGFMTAGENATDALENAIENGAAIPPSEVCKALLVNTETGLAIELKVSVR